MPWRYRLTHPLSIPAPELAHTAYTGAWLRIHAGHIHLPPGYAWDGCSPTLRLPGGPLLPHGLWLGPWDGPLGPDGRPVTWRASLAHDALCQFRGHITGLTREASVQLFARLLRESRAPGWLCHLYPLAVRHLGPQHWPGPAQTA